jgi:branched-chain amino acid transport system permease protein
VGLVIPLIDQGYWLHVAIITLYYMILSQSWNLVAGYTGLFHFANAAFAGVGAYTSSLIAIHFGLPPFLTAWLGCMFAGVIGLALGSISIRLAGAYLALSSIGLSEIVRKIITVDDFNITKGTRGLYTPPLFNTTSKIPWYYVGFVFLLLDLYLTYLLLKSKWGIALKAIRDDDVAARTCGINVARTKLLIFTLSSCISGLAGAFFAHYMPVISPDMIMLSEAAIVIVMTVVGGMGTIVGPIIGSILLEPLSEYLRVYGYWHLFIYGLMIVLVMRFFPDGIYGSAKKVYERFGVVRDADRKKT